MTPTSLICGAAFFVFLGVFVVACSGGGSRSAPSRRAAYGGPCGFCGSYSSNLAAHEAGHVAAARSLGYHVSGAVVRRDGTGSTFVSGWGANTRATAVIAAGGPAGEGRSSGGWGGGGSPGSAYTDAWFVHRYARAQARQRGVPEARVVREIRAEARRRVSSRSGDWRHAKAVLRRDGQL